MQKLKTLFLITISVFHSSRGMEKPKQKKLPLLKEAYTSMTEQNFKGYDFIKDNYVKPSFLTQHIPINTYTTLTKQYCDYVSKNPLSKNKKFTGNNDADQLQQFKMETPITQAIIATKHRSIHRTLVCLTGCGIAGGVLVAKGVDRLYPFQFPINVSEFMFGSSLMAAGATVSFWAGKGVKDYLAASRQTNELKNAYSNVSNIISSRLNLTTAIFFANKKPIKKDDLNQFNNQGSLNMEANTGADSRSNRALSVSSLSEFLKLQQ